MLATRKSWKPGKAAAEARERDRKIGEMRCLTDDLVTAACPCSATAYHLAAAGRLHRGKARRSYLHVDPCIGTVNLYKTSGHWDHYRENMFPPWRWR
ncbi:MAG: hypothetical protein ACLTGG_06310 [Subdoligranulum sp.]